MLVSFIVIGTLCTLFKNWVPFLVLCALFYIVPNPTGGNMIVPIAIIMAWILTKCGLTRSNSQIISTNSQISLMAFFLVMAGFATGLPFVVSSERFGETVFRVIRFAAIFGALPLLCEGWISQRHVRLCIFIIAALIAIYYSYLIFAISRDLSTDISQLESVQGELTIGTRTLELSRTHTGPTLAIACCTLWGFLLTESRFLLKGLTLGIFALGFSALIYTGARGALGVALFVCTFITCLFSWRTRRLNIVFLAAALFLCIIFAINMWLPQVLSVIELRLNGTSFSVEDYDRISRWLWSFDYFCSHPLGVGWTLAPLYRIEQAHNDLLVMAMSFGIFGFLAYLIAFQKELLFLINKSQGSNTMVFAITLPSFACLMALLFCGFMDMVLAIGWIFDVSWLMVLLAHAGNTNEGDLI